MLNIVPNPSKVKMLSEKRFRYTAENIIEISQEGFGDEGYRIVIDKRGILVFASMQHGFFNAKSTLTQLFVKQALPSVEIVDYPRFKYRGFMLDEARHFFGIKTVKKMLDAMALMKMNVFHWHLTDDQGFRLYLDRYPELSEKGGFRAGTMGDGIPVSGYYSKNEIREIIAYAKERFIEVIPEIDMPGHLAAAAYAYPHITCSGKNPGKREYFGIHEVTACIGKESTFEFFFDVLSEVADLFPSKYIHLGGDEALTGEWLKCPKCRKVMASLGYTDGSQLQAYFMSRLTAYLRRIGKTAVNWNDGMLSGLVPSDVVMQYWKEGEKYRKRAVADIKNGRKVIMSPFYKYYLDYPYGITPLKKTYMFEPEFPECAGYDGIIGVEAPLWTEYVENEKRLNYLVFPRLCAVAEAGWTQKDRRSYFTFKIRVKRLFKIFDKKGVLYANINEASPLFFARAIQAYAFYRLAKPNIKQMLKRQAADRAAIKKARKDKKR